MNERLYLKKAIFSTVVFILILTGCSGKRNDAEKPNHEEIGESGTEAYSESTEAVTEPSSGNLLSEPKLTEADNASGAVRCSGMISGTGILISGQHSGIPASGISGRL